MSDDDNNVRNKRHTHYTKLHYSDSSVKDVHIMMVSYLIFRRNLNEKVKVVEVSFLCTKRKIAKNK